MLGMCSVFAELEREIIRERIHAGLDRVRAKGKRLGRPRVHAKIEERIYGVMERGLPLSLWLAACSQGPWLVKSANVRRQVRQVI